METGAILQDLIQLARKDAGIREKFRETRNDPEPLSAFCRLARELGYELYEIDLINAGEEMYDAMKRSTNGGGANSPMLEGEDDYYEMFFLELESLD